MVAEVLRLLGQHRPPWLFIENVPFMLHLGKGEALGVIIAVLEKLQYRWAYRVVDSRAMGVPQRRRRVFLLAAASADPRDVLYVDRATAPTEPGKAAWREAACGFYWTEGRRGLGWAHDAIPTLKGGSTVGVPSAPAIVLPEGEPGYRVGMPDLQDAERLQGFDEGWTRAAETVGRRNLRWKLVGNAVTVGAAEWLGRRLRAPGDYDSAGDERLQRRRSWPNAAYDVGDGKMLPADVGEWPFVPDRQSLWKFLNHPLLPLSERAARGFYARLSNSTLRRPPGFLEVIREHADAVRRS